MKMTERVGSFVPERVWQPGSAPPDPALVDDLLHCSGLTAAISDALDERGLLTACREEVAWRSGAAKVIGRAVTLRYLPFRERPDGSRDRMAHRTLFGMAQPRDVAVISAPAGASGSLLGGEAVQAAADAGLSGCLVGGAVRDLDEIIEIGLPVWSTARTPATGRYRLEAVEINGPVDFGGVQVRAGDVAVADQSGIAFVPAERFEEIARVVLAS